MIIYIYIYMSIYIYVDVNHTTARGGAAARALGAWYI